MTLRSDLFLMITSLVLIPVAPELARSQMGGGCGMSHPSGHGATHEGNHKDPRASNLSQRIIVAPHGGVVHTTKEFQFETVYTEHGMRIYMLADDGAVMSDREVEGSVVLKPEKGKKTEAPLAWTSGTDDVSAKYRVRPGATANRTAGFLWADYDFRSASDGTVHVEIRLRDLPGRDEKKVKWAESFRQTPLFGLACPMHSDQASLEPGKCSKCEMDFQPAYVFFVACPACGEVRRTAPGICEKCGMDLELQAVGGQEPASKTSPQPRPDGHSH